MLINPFKWQWNNIYSYTYKKYIYIYIFKKNLQYITVAMSDKP